MQMKIFSIRAVLSGYACFIVCLCLGVSSCLGVEVTNTWTGLSDTDWFNAGNWDQPQYPQNGHHVIISDGTYTNILLTNATAQLASFEITNNCALTFSNWFAVLRATNVTIRSSGMLTLPSAFTNSAMSNRVYVICSNLVIDAGGVVNVDGKGYIYEQGPGAGGGNNAGGGYGGRGGRGSGQVTGWGGNPYGSASAPLAPGSGGENATGGSSGGGVTRIVAAGTVTVDGTLTANGLNGEKFSKPMGGGGSGGSIYITCMTFGGSTNGLLQVNGGDGGIRYVVGDRGGGGSGGRIAVAYSNLSGPPGVRFSASEGFGWGEPTRGNRWQLKAEWGTLYFPDTNLLEHGLVGGQFTDVNLVIPGFTGWTVADLFVTNSSARFAEPTFQLTVTGTLSLDGGTLVLGTNCMDEGICAIRCGDDLILTNGGALYIYSGHTNASGYGALVSATNDIFIASNSWIYPVAHGTNGAAVLFRMRNLYVAANGGINAYGLGFSGEMGPSMGEASGGGAGHGGKGGRDRGVAVPLGGPVYGSPDPPFLPGSGGGVVAYAGYGGGLIWIDADETVTVRGLLIADGQPGERGSAYGAGGAGGAIDINCNVLAGNADGLLSVIGGDGGRQVHGITMDGAVAAGVFPCDVAALDGPGPGSGRPRRADMAGQMMSPITIGTGRQIWEPSICKI